MSYFSLEFEWHEAKARANERKHGVTFAEACTVFADPLTLLEGDAVNPERFRILGISSSDRLLLVVYAEKNDGNTVRILSARFATRQERRAYEEGEAW